MRYAYNMMVDGVSTNQYGYLIATLGDNVDDGKGTSETNIFSRNNITSDARYLGSKEKELLSFNVSLAKIEDGNIIPLTTYDRDFLDFWLTGGFDMKRIEFDQDDYQGMYYNGKINKVEWKNVGNKIYTCEFVVETDSPYGHKNETTEIFTTKSFSIHNDSHGDLWTLPKIKLTMSGTGSDISIKNKTDKNRTFTITGLTQGEVVEINCRTGEIKSSTLLNRKGQCNLKYPRLAYGMNEFEITGNVSSIEFTYGRDVRIGA